MNSDAYIYLDYNATTPVDPEIFSEMEPYFKEHFGNSASAGHPWGWKAENAAERARLKVANLIGAKPNEVFFTSGATESNNWAVFGLVSKLREENPTEPIHILTSNVEHSSIKNSLEALTKQNVEVDFLPVNQYGQIEVETVRKALKPHTKMLSFIWINNEIGSINPISELAALCKEKKIYFHTDATQAIGKIPMNVTDLGIDLMSFSGHKIYGPKGIGALFMRAKDPKVQIHPLLYGGGHERGQRSGTLNVPGIVGLGAAASFCQKNQVEETARLIQLRDMMWEKLQMALPGVLINGHPTERSCNNLNITLSCSTDSLLPQIQNLGVSTGSACGTGQAAMSHVLKGLGLSLAESQRTLRISLGRWTTEKEILRAVEILQNAIPKRNA
jgi:cysteine desulfurase